VISLSLSRDDDDDCNNADMFIFSLSLPDLKATALLKLIYLEMFGHDMSWASFHVLEVMSSAKYHQKRVGYLGAVQSFRQDTEVLMLATNLLKKVRTWLSRVVMVWCSMADSSFCLLGLGCHHANNHISSDCNSSPRHHALSSAFNSFRLTTTFEP
jgi:hypothetical protein